jgi:Na+/melibiose symporter-like transporter
MNTFNVGIAWGRVGAIALVQAAITLLWLVYRLYFGDLLAGWGFSEAFTTQLLTVEMVLALIMEPIFGSLSDRQQQRLGSRGPLIVLGIILTAAISIGFPLFAALNLNVGKVLLPSLAIIWALAMTIFRAPIYALLAISASRQGLPLAMGFLMMTGGFTNLLKDPLKPLLLGLGPISCFAIASLGLMSALLTFPLDQCALNLPR